MPPADMVVRGAEYLTHPARQAGEDGGVARLLTHNNNRPRLVARGGFSCLDQPGRTASRPTTRKRPFPKNNHGGPKFASELAIPPHRAALQKPTKRCRSRKGCGWTNCLSTQSAMRCATKRVRSGLTARSLPPKANEQWSLFRRLQPALLDYQGSDVRDCDLLLARDRFELLQGVLGVESGTAPSEPRWPHCV